GCTPLPRSEMKSKRKAGSSMASSEALAQEYNYFAGLLTTNEESTKMAQASAVHYFRRLFTENTEPPNYFDEGVIDVFISIVRNTCCAMDTRADAAWAITNLLCSKKRPLTHTIIEKRFRYSYSIRSQGALDVFEWCIRTADYKLRDQCIWGVGNIAADCSDCKEAVRATDVLEIIAKQIHSGAFHSLESSRCAIWCCLNILRGGNATVLPRTARLLLTGLTRTMLRTDVDATLLQDSLLTLALLADDRNFLQYPHLWPAQIDAMISEPGLISRTLEAVASGDSRVVSPALRLIGNIITGTDEQTELVIMREGFVRLIAHCLDCSESQVRREAAWILSNIAAGPPHHVQLILTDPPLIDQLLRLLHKDDTRMQKEICWVFANVLSSLNTTPRPAQMTDFLGYGVLAIVDVASRPFADTRLVNKIREVLSALLVVHPEFWGVVEKAAGDRTPLLEIPRRKRRVADYVIYDEEAVKI
ncbi:hypothetical protein PENTCL1PPCAC_5657, partial [Pristionchus entomophagus]